MTEKRLPPCSLYDIQGMQDWLDEMALQGLFFQRFSRFDNSAVLQTGEPRPVRYRLDPVGRSKKEDRLRREPYAQMGWEFLDAQPRLYSVYSCQAPEAPELHSDPVTLGYALNNAIRQQISFWGRFTLGLALLLSVLFFLISGRLFEELLFMERPRSLFQLVLSIVIALICLAISWLQIRRLVKTRRLLDQGLPMEPGRRWNKSRFLAIYFCAAVPLAFLILHTIPDHAPEIRPLNEAELSRPWPTLAQLEGTGPLPLDAQPAVEGYAITNRSWLVPVQEYASIDWEVHTFHPATGEVTALDRPYALWMGVQYHRARSQQVAEQVFQLERKEAARTLDNWSEWTDHTYHITGPADLVPQTWPGLDRLETARYTQQGQQAWTLAALRGKDVLVVQYVGFARLEDCLPLFLEALDQPVKGE